jgi:hypothetical protein
MQSVENQQNVSEEYIACIFKVGEQAMQETSMKQGAEYK